MFYVNICGVRRSLISCNTWPWLSVIVSLNIIFIKELFILHKESFLGVIDSRWNLLQNDCELFVAALFEGHLIQILDFNICLS